MIIEKKNKMQLFEIFRPFTDQRYLHYIILLIYIILCNKMCWSLLVSVGRCWSRWSVGRGIHFKLSCFFFFWKIDEKPLNMKNSSVVSSPSEFQGYDKLPEGYRLAAITDFVEKGRLKSGMVFLIRWASREYYQHLSLIHI